MIAAKAHYLRDRDLQLNRCFAAWIRELQPKFLLTHALAWIVYRVVLLARGDVGWTDLLVLGLLFAAHPFVEWLIHVLILHHRPRKLLGFKLDFHAARMHRLHHRDPWDIRFILMPLPIMILGLGSAAVALYFVTPTPGVWATIMAASALTAAYYEWIHFLTHTSYKPQGRVYRRQWRLHRLHHFKNEHYWLGVTRHFGDRVLGTLTQADDVETSKTARTLGYDGDDLD